MKEYVLNYYPHFKCVAGKCKHTCCAGWKMNIDEQSLSAYKNEKSVFCELLKKGINFKKSCFKVDKNGRCAFLNDCGLCEIIINLGEQSLCQVCRDHPRFRSFFNDKIETGLGFCCEQASKVILAYKEKIQPILLSDDREQNQLDFIQTSILDFRKKALDIVQDRGTDINQRIDNLLLLSNAKLCEKDFTKILKSFLSFERLDNKWSKRLKSIKETPFTINTGENLAHYAEQFLSNSLYRHLYDAEDTMWVRARTIACVFGWWIVNNIFMHEKNETSDDFELIVDIIRAYSLEVEYSQNNLDKLFKLAYKFIKI